MLGLIRRLRFVLTMRRRSKELDEELAFHRAMKERELEAGGLAPNAARLAAQRALGNDLSARENARDVWLAPWLHDLTQDVRFAGRLMIKEKGFTVLAVIALGLGIGVNHTMFSIVNAFCIRGLPIPDPDRVVFISTRDSGGRGGALSFPEFDDLRASIRSTRSLAAYSVAPVALRDEGRVADRVVAAYASPTLFAAIGVRPIRGREIREGDDAAGAAPVVIVGHGVWQRRYGGDEDIIGRTVIVNGAPAAVIGVMSDGFGFPNNAEIWLPLTAWPGSTVGSREARTLSVIGRLIDDASLAQARAEVEATGQRWTGEHRATNEGVRAELVPINERFMAQLTQPAWLAFLTAGIVVVLVACANVANLLLSRAVARTREIAIRSSIGATRFRVVRQLLAESALLALLGGLTGYALSIAGLQLMEAAIPAAARAYWLDFSMDARAFTMLTTVCASAVLVFGLVPALHVSKTSPLAVLQDAGRGPGGGLRARRWTAVFLTAELGLTMILLSGLGGSVASTLARQRAEVIIDPAPILTMMVSLPPEKYPTPARRVALFDALHERLRGVAPIAAFAVATSLPLAGAPSRGVAIDGRPPLSPRLAPTVRTVTVSEGYFAAIGLRLSAGRPFDSLDGTHGRATAIVNETFAATHFAGVSAIGKRIRLLTQPPASAPSDWLTIVGVSPAVRQRPDPEPEPIVYLPHRSDPPAAAALMVRAVADPSTLSGHVRKALHAIDADLPVYRTQPLQEAMSDATWNGRVSAWIITIIASIAACLSIVGLYAVTVHAVSQRRHELGVRAALGARPGDLRWLVLRRAIWQVAAGLVVGVLGAYGWDRLFGLGRGGHPITLALVAAALALVAVAACLVPANRAARLDPVVALRTD